MLILEGNLEALDIAEFMRDGAGPFVVLKSATKMQLVQARVDVRGCQKNKSGVAVKLSAGSGSREVCHTALIPWDQITFQPTGFKDQLGNTYNASVHWRDWTLSGYADHKLTAVLPPEALARFNVSARDIPKPDPEKEARWKAEASAMQTAAQKEKEALNLLRRNRDQQVVTAYAWHTGRHRQCSGRRLGLHHL